MADDKSGMNDQTGLPHSMTLSEVFDKIRLAPAEVATLLTHFGASFHGGPNQPLASKLQSFAADITNPATYSNEKPRNVDPRDLDAQGREVTPRRSEMLYTDTQPSTASLNPGGYTAPTSVPVDEPARPAYAQHEPRVADAGADNPRVEPVNVERREPQVADAGADNPRVAPDANVAPTI